MAEENGSRQRALSFFQYLTELARLRTPSTPDVNSYRQVLWYDDLPRDEVINTIAWGTQGESGELPWLEVKRRPEPELSEAPGVLRSWMAAEPEGNGSLEPTLQEQILRPGSEVWERMEDHPEVGVAFDEYLTTVWRPWKVEHDAWQAAHDVYRRLFEVHQEQRKLGEGLELVLGLGLLAWQTASGQKVRRHVLVAQAALEFESSRGIFTVKPASEGAKLTLELDMLDPKELPPAQELQDIEKLVEGSSETPWDQEAVADILRRLAHSLHERGEYRPSLRPEQSVTLPRISLAPALILRKRSSRSLLAFLETVRRHLVAGGPLPDEVERLCSEGLDSGPVASESSGESSPRAGPPEPVYFPLPVNEEQLSILDRLSHSSGVLVQGPPGTGKSHTIANLMCQLLATGQRVLVTAQTPRALAVLQKKIPEGVSKLCVSLLGNDRTAFESLERCVLEISERRTSWVEAADARRIRDLESRLENERRRLAELETLQRALRERDAFPHEIAGGAYRGTCQRIAQRVVSEDYNWLADEVPEAVELPLGADEIVGLREGFLSIDKAREEELRKHRPDSGSLLAVKAIEQLIRDEAEARKVLESSGDATNDHDRLVEAGEEVVRQLQDALRRLARAVSASRARVERWLPEALRSVLSSQGKALVGLKDRTANGLQVIRDAAKRAERSEVRYPPGVDPAKLQADAEDLNQHIKNGGGLGLFGVFNETVRRTAYLQSVTVAGRPCKDRVALEKLLEILKVRRELDFLWKTWQGRAERVAGSFSHQVAVLETHLEALDYLLKVVAPALAAARGACGLVAGLGEPAWTEDHARQRLEGACNRVLAELAMVRASGHIQKVLYNLIQARRPNSHPVIQTLIDAVQSRSTENYARAMSDLGQLEADSRVLAVRDERHAVLAAAAPQIASSIATTAADVVWDARLKQIVEAWAWRRAKSWLLAPERAGGEQGIAQSVSAAESSISRLQGELSAAKAWMWCFQRMKDHQRQDLMAWQHAMKRARGKYAARWLQTAQRHLAGCRQAIPAWVMPLHRVFETVDPEPEMFDVIIVDEASQCGPDALALLYLAKRIVVVGDDQQISPEAVGVDRERVFTLIDRHLGAFRHKDSFVIDTSLFAYADIRYGNRVVLREHFRCMPEIIRFSNELCYEAQPLRPLRQYPVDRLRPLVLQRVASGYAEGTTERVVNRPEAERLVEALVTCCRDPRYGGLSMGVISLQGEAQADLIESLLLERLDPKEIEERRIVCGDAYSFQGDERDVMFLSLVAAANRRIGALTTDSAKRRFNVAASRARDQLWLFHTATVNDLNPDCMRHRLLSFFVSPPKATAAPGVDDVPALHAVAETQRRDRIKPPEPFESWFEVDVFLRIWDRGLRVLPQYPMSQYRIDLMIEGPRGRLAVECDGDEWHGADRFSHDMARQRALQRCGLAFWRLRGSAFYLNPEAALAPLWKDVDRRGIKPWPQDQSISLDGYIPALAPEVRTAEAPAAPFEGSPQPEPAAQRREPVARREQAGPLLPTLLRAAEQTREAIDSREPLVAPSPSDRVQAPVVDDLVEWTSTVPAQTWFALSHWAKVNNKLAPWERSLVFNIGRRVAREQPVTSKQAVQCRRVYDLAMTEGFQRDGDA